jgi:hypothetical protein
MKTDGSTFHASLYMTKELWDEGYAKKCTKRNPCCKS